MIQANTQNSPSEKPYSLVVYFERFHSDQMLRVYSDSPIPLFRVGDLLERTGWPPFELPHQGYLEVLEVLHSIVPSSEEILHYSVSLRVGIRPERG